MSELFEELERAANRCERIAYSFDDKLVVRIVERVQEQIQRAHDAWAGSPTGPFACIYIQNLEPRAPGEAFDAESAAVVTAGGTHGRWMFFDEHELKSEILRRTGLSREHFTHIERLTKNAKAVFHDAQVEVLSILDLALAHGDGDPALQTERTKIASLTSHRKRQDVLADMLPTMAVTREARARAEGSRSAPHLQLQAALLSQLSYAVNAMNLAQHARYVAGLLRKRTPIRQSSGVQTRIVSAEQHRKAVTEAQAALVEDQDALDAIDPYLFEALSQFLRRARGVRVEEKSLIHVQAEMMAIFEDVWGEWIAKGMKSGVLPKTLRTAKAVAGDPTLVAVAKSLIEP
ncbi:hypothetical protein [Pendulispora albinea]|uniref:Uncharacterized protein n=1 Tax=Pendulispora albinea TaxID=2741071 RepID=A0ABZ2MA14_9BACT